MVSKRVSVKDRVKQDSLFTPTISTGVQADNKTNKLVNNKTIKQDDDFKRQTYYLSDDLIQAIAFKSVFEKRDKSEVVRAALKAYIEDKYFNLQNEQ